MARVVVSIILLTLVYAMTLASFDPWDLAIGAALSALILWLFRRHMFIEPAIPARELLSRIVYFVPFVYGLIVNIVQGTVQVAAIVVGLRPLRQPGIVKVPIGERTRLGVAMTSLETALSPGTFMIDVDWEENVMLIHSIDASDPDEVRADHQNFYERYQRKVFP